MKVLVVGGGGREHALCWKLAQSPLVEQLYCTPGNAGIAEVAECLPGEPLDVARCVGAEFVVVGPEDPLARGLVDQLLEAGIAAFGPTREGARLEASKSFCKDLLVAQGIPTARFAAFTAAEPAKAYIRDHAGSAPLVVKADGLAAGKGVVVAESPQEAEQAVDLLLPLGGQVIIEECLPGDEVSLIALTDGETVLPLVPAQDHKRLGEGDTGPNTGGMGCYSPVPAFPAAACTAAVSDFLQPTVRGLAEAGVTYRGALYAGLMLTPHGPQVLEYNCRFGDPETQVILPRLKSDLLPLLLASARHPAAAPLGEQRPEWTDEAAVCVVMAAGGYPASDYRRADAIEGLEAARQAGALVFHAGTTRREGRAVTSGGRVLGVVALGDGFLQARQRCYNAVELISFEGAQYRRDIGWRCL